MHSKAVKAARTKLQGWCKARICPIPSMSPLLKAARDAWGINCAVRVYRKLAVRRYLAFEMIGAGQSGGACLARHDCSLALAKESPGVVDKLDVAPQAKNAASCLRGSNPKPRRSSIGQSQRKSSRPAAAWEPATLPSFAASSRAVAP